LALCPVCKEKVSIGDGGCTVCKADFGSGSRLFPQPETNYERRAMEAARIALSLHSTAPKRGPRNWNILAFLCSALAGAAWLWISIVVQGHPAGIAALLAFYISIPIAVGVSLATNLFVALVTGLLSSCVPGNLKLIAIPAALAVLGQLAVLSMLAMDDHRSLVVLLLHTWWVGVWIGGMSFVYIAMADSANASGLQVGIGN
jgi:hypothetical protein